MPAYFCEKTGIRIAKPGIAKSAGGDVEEYTEKAPPQPKRSKEVVPKRTAKTEEKD